MQRKLVVMGSVFLLFFLFTGNSWAANLLLNGEKSGQPEQVGDLGWIHWNQGLVKAIGISKSKDASLAKQEAIKNAYINLNQMISSINVNEKEKVKDYLLKDSTLQSKLQNFIESALFLEQKQEKNGVFRVVVAVNLYGNNGLASLFTASSSKAGYTGLVVDVTGLGLQRTPTPKIFDDAGQEVYGTVNVDWEYVEERGIVSYACTPEAVTMVKEGKSRAGSNPLIVQALGLSNHACNVIISITDAEKVREAEKENGFLKKYAVVLQQN